MFLLAGLGVSTSVFAADLGIKPIKTELFSDCYEKDNLDSCAKLAFFAKNKESARRVLQELCKADQKYCFDLLDFADSNKDVVAQAAALSGMCTHGNKHACALIIKNLGGANI